MSSVITSRQHHVVAPRNAGPEWLRCPGERAALALCILSNLVVIALAIGIVTARTSWLEAHPLVARHIEVIRTIVLAAMIAFPAGGLARHMRLSAACNGAVRVGEQQFPELYAQFRAACRKLGVDRVPELYVGREVEGVAEAHTLAGGRAVVVINAEFIDEDWRDGLDWLTFVAAGAVGAMVLGHTRWWVELLTVYVRGIPGLRTPLLVRWTHSRDRCAAFVVPDGIRGLIVEGVGNHALSSVDVPAFVEQTERVGGLWDRLANFLRKRPSLVTRARALYESGLFDRARDRRRHTFLPPSATEAVA